MEVIRHGRKYGHSWQVYYIETTQWANWPVVSCLLAYCQFSTRERGRGALGRSRYSLAGMAPAFIIAACARFDTSVANLATLASAPSSCPGASAVRHAFKVQSVTPSDTLSYSSSAASNSFEAADELYDKLEARFFAFIHLAAIILLLRYGYQYLVSIPRILRPSYQCHKIILNDI